MFMNNIFFSFILEDKMYTHNTYHVLDYDSKLKMIFKV